MLQGLPTKSVNFFNLFYITPDLLILTQFIIFIIVGALLARVIGMIASLLMYVVFVFILFFCLYVVGSFTSQASSFDGFLLYIDFILSTYLPFFMPIVASWGFLFGIIILYATRRISNRI